MRGRILTGVLAAALALSGCSSQIPDADSRTGGESITETASQSTASQTEETTSLWSPAPLVTAAVTEKETAAASTAETKKSKAETEKVKSETTKKYSSAETEKQEAQTTKASAKATAGTSAAQTKVTSQTTKKAVSAAVTVQAPAADPTDKTKPVVFYGGYGSYHIRGTAFDLNDYVGYGDDRDRHPKLTYTGKVDANKVGDYPIRATVTDASGNSVSWDLTIHVVNSYPSGSGSSSIPSMSFDTFKSKYKGSDTRFGIDVSQWQGSIDFNAVKNAGCSFVFIRVGSKYGSYTLDPYFKQNLKNAQAAGLDVGVYIYTTDHTAAGGRDSAKWIIKQLDGAKLTLPVAFDWEELVGFQKLGASIGDINDAYRAFKAELSSAGLGAMIYGSPLTLGSLWDDTNKASSPVWLANYVEQTTYSGNYGIWQVCYGRIAGIGGNTDFNVLYTDKRYK